MTVSSSTTIQLDCLIHDQLSLAGEVMSPEVEQKKKETTPVSSSQALLVPYRHFTLLQGRHTSRLLDLTIWASVNI